MSDERDPKLLELFAQRPDAIDGEAFTAKLIDRIEREQKAKDRLRLTVRILLLVGVAFALPTIVRYLSVVSSDLAMELRTAESMNEASRWWLPAVFSVMALGVAAIWRTLRGAR